MPPVEGRVRGGDVILRGDCSFAIFNSLQASGTVVFCFIFVFSPTGQSISSSWQLSCPSLCLMLQFQAQAKRRGVGSGASSCEGYCLAGHLVWCSSERQRCSAGARRSATATGCAAVRGGWAGLASSLPCAQKSQPQPPSVCAPGNSAGFITQVLFSWQP